jgi:hypothetical protein
VPIHFFPVLAGLHDTYAIVIDQSHGLPPLHLEVGGSDFAGGVEGSVRLGKGNTMHATIIHSPLLLLVIDEDTMDGLQGAAAKGPDVLGGAAGGGTDVESAPPGEIAQGYLQLGLVSI